MKHPSLSDDPFQLPNYSDMIVIPFRIPPGMIAPRSKRTAQLRPERSPADESAGALSNRWPDGRASPIHASRDAPPVPATGRGLPAAELIVAGVQGQPGLVVSGFKGDALTLCRRGKDGTPPQALASFAADLDGSLYDAWGQCLGRLHGNAAPFHPDWLQTLDVDARRPGQERPSAPLIQVQEEEEERPGHLPGEHIPKEPELLHPFPVSPLTPEEMERHQGPPVPLSLPSTLGQPRPAAIPKGNPAARFSNW